VPLHRQISKSKITFSLIALKINDLHLSLSWILLKSVICLTQENVIFSSDVSNSILDLLPNSLIYLVVFPKICLFGSLLTHKVSLSCFQGLGVFPVVHSSFPKPESRSKFVLQKFKQNPKSMFSQDWGGDFRSTMMMFESIMKSILMYGAEIWGWKEEEEVEKLQKKIFEMGGRGGQRNASERRV
jgi:hypothetical protein